VLARYPEKVLVTATMNTTALEALVASMPLSDLAQRSGRSVDEIVSWALSGVSAPAVKSAPAAAPARASAKAAEPAPKAASPVIRRRGAVKAAPAPVVEEEEDEEAGEVDTRTPAGRDRYDKAVLNMVLNASQPIAAATIRSDLGGTPLQVRASLNRLIEDGKVEYQGQARAMRYTAR